ncbi:MAG: X-Pro dipeptidyl-peptidase, partial [Candidatus Hydrogenedentes bacterium]|nr:X-Pro dipeptidyl-peptidase [Candidatus Hydrogenedentota bacterium]
MLTAYRRCIIALALLLLCPALHAMAAETPTHLRLPMSDGTELATDYYLPGTPEEGPWPIILVRSTYGRVGGPLQAILRLGYGVVVQDVRGMGESAGEPYVFHADG